MKKQTIVWLLLFGCLCLQAQDRSVQQTVTFKFAPGEDAFYLLPRSGNDVELTRLYDLIDRYKTQITSGTIPVYVDGYCTSGTDATSNLRIAMIRSNRVKAMMIIKRGLLEEHFKTKNHATSYQGMKDVVIVTLHLPAVAGEQKPVVEPTPQAQLEPESKSEPKTKTEPKTEPLTVIREETEVVTPTVAQHTSGAFALRTNLLYDAFLVPTLGVEWRVSEAIGLKVDGSWSGWGDEHGKVQKLWMVNPEVRRYMGAGKRFYLGLGATVGAYNIYKGMLGNLISDDTGYQGSVYGGGLTLGYQARLSHCLSLDFNLGLGYAQFNYDSFHVIDGTRLYVDKDQTKNWFGPTQAGVSLVWRLGGK